jgi:hypothetical protein
VDWIYLVQVRDHWTLLPGVNHLFMDSVTRILVRLEVEKCIYNNLQHDKFLYFMRPNVYWCLSLSTCS